MERLLILKKRFRDYYAGKHATDPGIAFEDVYPRSPQRSLARAGHTAFFGLAACVLLMVGAILFYRGYGEDRSPMTLEDGMLLGNLEQGLRQSTVLGLSAAQARALNAALDDALRTLPGVDGFDPDDARFALLQTLLESPVLALSNDQAIAMTGLLSSWRPGAAQSSHAGQAWLDDDSLALFVADCSTYCHQPGDAAVHGNAGLRSYLVDCLDARKTTQCAAGGIPGQAPENRLF